MVLGREHEALLKIVNIKIWFLHEQGGTKDIQIERKSKRADKKLKPKECKSYCCWDTVRVEKNSKHFNKKDGIVKSVDSTLVQRNEQIHHSTFVIIPSNLSANYDWPKSIGWCYV